MDLKLREPVDIASIVQVSVTIVIMLVLMVLVYFIRLRVKSSKKTKSLKHLKEGSLLSESV